MVKRDLERSFVQYGLDKETTNSWDSIHTSFVCCGIRNFTDFDTNTDRKSVKSVPESCCESTNEKPEDLPLVSKIHCNSNNGKRLVMKGCQEDIESLLLASSSQIGSFISFAALIWLVSCLVSVGLTRDLCLKETLPPGIPQQYHTTSSINFISQND